MSTVAVIGSGMGGLVAGNLLAKKGHKVTIFESHNAPGGYTAGFRRNGFYFESGTLSFELSETVFGVMKKIGVLEKIPFVRQHGRWKFKDLDRITRSYGDFKKALLEAFPEEKENLSGYYAEVDRMYGVLLALYKSRNVFDTLRFPFRLARVVRLFRKYEMTGVPEFTARFFATDSPPYRILKNLGYPDMPAAILGGAAFTFFDDYWTVETGMQSWADCLADRFRELGGELRLGSEVEKIITRDGAAAGVVSRGDRHEADYVVAAGDYKKTFLRLVDDRELIPAGLRERIEKAPVSEGFFTVYLGLDLPSGKMKEYLEVPHVYFSDDYWDADVYDSRDEKYFEKAWIVLYSPSLMNPELAPENHSSLMIQAMSPPRWMDNWGGGDREAYKKLKDTVKRTLIDKTSLLIPDLRRHVVFEDAATPLTYERFTHNTWGASSAWSWNPSQKFHKNIWDPAIETPVKNLLVGSSWALQLGGIPGAIQAALACVKRIK